VVGFCEHHDEASGSGDMKLVANQNMEKASSHVEKWQSLQSSGCEFYSFVRNPDFICD
jgi:hypothetical protein